MGNFGLIAAEIDPVVWGTPANFNGFRVLASLLHGTHQPNFAALNGGRHLCLAGWPSRWALAHILVLFLMLLKIGVRVYVLYMYTYSVVRYKMKCLVCAEKLTVSQLNLLHSMKETKIS